MVLVGLDKGQIAHYEYNTLEMAYELKLTHLLVEHCDQLLALFAKFVKSILLLEHTRLGLAATCSLDWDKTIAKIVSCGSCC